MNGTQSASTPFPPPVASPHATRSIRCHVKVQERGPGREMVHGGGGGGGMRQRLDVVDSGGQWRQMGNGPTTTVRSRAAAPSMVGDEWDGGLREVRDTGERQP